MSAFDKVFMTLCLIFYIIVSACAYALVEVMEQEVVCVMQTGEVEK